MNTSKSERKCRFALAVLYLTMIALGLSKYAAAGLTADLSAASQDLGGGEDGDLAVACEGTCTCPHSVCADGTGLCCRSAAELTANGAYHRPAKVAADSRVVAFEGSQQTWLETPLPWRSPFRQAHLHSARQPSEHEISRLQL